MHKLHFLLLMCLLLVLAVPAIAQDATIVGTVTDQSNAVVPNATVTITNIDMGLTRTLTTNEAGQYVAGALHIGNYTVKATSKGFTSTEKKGIVLNVGDRTRIDFSLTVGAETQSVTVEANAIAVKTDTGEISSIINADQVTNLAMNGRSIYSLINLTPGATSLQADFQTPTPMNADKNVSFNGQRVAHNLFLIDGAEAADRGGSGMVVMPSVDSIAEFRQLTSNYSAEYGMSSSATVTTVLKSGAKSFHAGAWYNGRNDFMNARNFFNPEHDAKGNFLRQPKERFNLWGFNVSGPVQFSKDSTPKTFFFYNMEWRRRITGGSCCQSQKVPFTQSYNGDMSLAVASGNGSTGLIANGQTLHVPNFSTLSPAQQARFTALGLASGQPFPNNTIPASLIDPNAKALLAAGIFPAPLSGMTIGVPKDAPTNVKEEIVRVDHNFNDKVSIFGHFIAEQVMQTDIPTRWSGGANLPTVYDTFGNPSYSGVVHLTHTISPALLNEVAFNYGGNRINIQPQGIYKLADTGFTTHKLFGNTEDVTPIINLSGKTGARYDANWAPWNNTADSYQWRDDISWTKGRHQTKFGGGILYFRKMQPLQTAPQGNFGFNGSFTGYDFADFLLGYAQSYSEVALKDPRNWNSISYSLYVQDNWRATSRLTLNLGLRWDGMPHTAEVNGKMSNFIPSLYDPAKAPIFAPNSTNYSQLCSGPDIPHLSGCTQASPALAIGPSPDLNGLLQYRNGLVVPGYGTTQGLVGNHWNNWGPRIGFAYDLTGSGKTVIRGGFGIMFERIQGNDMYQAGGNNLYGGNTTVNNVLLSNPHQFLDKDFVISSDVLPVTVNDLQVLDANRYKNPTTYQFSAGVQRQVTERTVVSASYVGSQSRHQSYRTEINLPDQSLLGMLDANTTNQALYRSKVPYLGYRAINMAQNAANGEYNSLQVEVRSKLKDLQIQAGYTLSKAMDPATGTNGNDFDLNQTTNPYLGWKYDWGPSVFDRRHVAFINYIYDFPFFKHSSNKFLKNTVGGWSMSGIVSIMSGAPINIGLSGAGYNPPGGQTGYNVCGLVPNCFVRPNLVGPVKYEMKPYLLNGSTWTYQYIEASAFAPNLLNDTVATWGNLPKGYLRGPGRHNWNVAMTKTVNFGDRLKFEFRGECFNLWNHTQFNVNTAGGGGSTGIGNSLNGSNFGVLTSAFDARSFQLGAKIIF